VVGRDGVKFEVSAKKHRVRSVCIGDVPPQASADAHSRCRRHFFDSRQHVGPNDCAAVGCKPF
jgi:hypothetical protein